MKKVIVSALVFIFAIFSIHTTAFAYSYGDPNEEKVAEAYKQMVVRLDENPPNYAETKVIYDSVREEIDMHMGAEPSEAILKNIKEEDKEALVENMEKVLALNINRRLSNVDENFEDYDTSKRLLAKAFATYEALSPVVASTNKELDTTMRDEFNKALEALGNPGLFGVGQKEANKDAFVQSKDIILNHLKETFHIKDFAVGHFTGEEESTASQKTEWTDLSSVKNWLPIVVLVAVIIGVVVYAIRRRR